MVDSRYSGPDVPGADSPFMQSEAGTNTGNIFSISREQEVGAQAKEKRFAIVELFGPTIQGEGPLAGSKCMFVRFGGCDYKCVKCDSMHAVAPMAVKKHSRYLTAQAIADELIPTMEESGTDWVVFSGGNPCMWDLTELIQLLHQANKFVSVETQGTLAPDWLVMCQMVIVSPKSPGMGEKFEPDKFTRFITKCQTSATLCALKVVIFSQQDFEFALEVRELAGDKIMPGLSYFSLGNPYPPVLNEELDLEDPASLDGKDLRLELLREYRILIEDMVVDPRIRDWKFLPQTHVLIWANESEH